MPVRGSRQQLAEIQPTFSPGGGSKPSAAMAQGGTGYLADVRYTAARLNSPSGAHWLSELSLSTVVGEHLHQVKRIDGYSPFSVEPSISLAHS